LAHHFERFEQVYEERFESAFGFLRKVVQKSVFRFLDCGILEQGFARLYCKECRRSYAVAFSCRQRCICPSCHQKRELIWVDFATEDLLEDVPHRQVVFTIPKRLRIYFRYDRKLLGELAGCAWRAIRLYLLAAFDSEDIQPGAVGFIQTAGELLRYHPHIHVLLADGAWLPDGSFRHLLYFDVQHVQRLFRAEVFRLLLVRGKISQETVDAMLQWPHSGFSVHGAVRVETRDEAARLGRYMIRCPIVLERLKWDEERQEVVYTAHPRKLGGPYGSEARWDVLDFIARMTQHIPDGGQQYQRYWGFYSNAARGKHIRDAAEDSESSEEPTADPNEDEGLASWKKRRRISWAQLIRKVLEVDPMLCPFCGGRLQVLSFTLELGAIRRFLASIDCEGQEPEPLGHSPPHEELLFEPC
jgi:hypothetical protein